MKVVQLDVQLNSQDFCNGCMRNFTWIIYVHRPQTNIMDQCTVKSSTTVTFTNCREFWEMADGWHDESCWIQTLDLFISETQPPRRAHFPQTSNLQISWSLKNSIDTDVKQPAAAYCLCLHSEIKWVRLQLRLLGFCLARALGAHLCGGLQLCGANKQQPLHNHLSHLNHADLLHGGNMVLSRGCVCVLCGRRGLKERKGRLDRPSRSPESQSFSANMLLYLMCDFSARAWKQWTRLPSGRRWYYNMCRSTVCYRCRAVMGSEWMNT